MPFKDFRQLYDTLAIPIPYVHSFAIESIQYAILYNPKFRSWGPEMFVAPRFPDPQDIIAAGGKVEGTSTEFHCVNGVCDGKVLAPACCSIVRLLFATKLCTSIPPLTRRRIPPLTRRRWSFAERVVERAG